MMEVDRELQCSILTPDGPVFSGAVRSIVAPAVDGEVGILFGHAPLITALGAGSLRVHLRDGGCEAWMVAGGFVEVLDNDVSILARIAERAEEIDPKEARRQLEEAEKLDRHTRLRTREEGDISGDLLAVARARLRHLKRHGRQQNAS